MASESVVFTSGGRQLYGVLECPQGPPCGAVVLVHGWDGCRMGPHRILVEAARHLCRLGFAAMRFDLSGRGESAGEPHETDLDMMVDDARAAADVLMARVGQTVPMALMGMCSGGNVALAAAAFRPRVAAVAAWSTYPFQEQRPAFQGARRTGHFAGVYLGKALRPETWRRLLRGRINVAMVGKVLFGRFGQGDGVTRQVQRSRRDVLGVLAAYRGRVLFVYGGKDPEAPAAESAFRQFCTEHGLTANYSSVAGANHNFYSLAWKRQAIETTGRWLADALAERL